MTPLEAFPRVVIYPIRDNIVACSYLFKVSRRGRLQKHIPNHYQGIWFFLTHPYLHPLLRTRLLPAVILSVFVLFNLFFWTLLPQVAFLAIFHRSGSAWVNGTFLVLGEGAAIVAILFECFLVDETQVDVHDAVLVSQGFEDLVKNYRPVSEDSLNNPLRRLGKPTKSSVYGPFSFQQIAEFCILLPVNFVPYVGVPLFLLLTGYRAGPLQHHRYLKLRGFDRKQRHAFVKKRRWQYMWYGAVYLLLQLVPLLSMVFLVTAAASSALWAADLERTRQQQ